MKRNSFSNCFSLLFHNCQKITLLQFDFFLIVEAVERTISVQSSLVNNSSKDDLSHSYPDVDDLLKVAAVSSVENPSDPKANKQVNYYLCKVC